MKKRMKKENWYVVITGIIAIITLMVYGNILGIC